jgi:hypothetical protein
MEKQNRRREHIAAWKSSGLTQREYARNNGVNMNTFAYWLSKERNFRNQKFIEVPLPEPEVYKKSLLSFTLRLGFLQFEYRREKQ